MSASLVDHNFSILVSTILSQNLPTKRFQDQSKLVIGHYPKRHCPEGHYQRRQLYQIGQYAVRVLFLLGIDSVFCILCYFHVCSFQYCK